MMDPHLNDKQRSLDWTLIGAVLGLMAVGLLFIYSASAGESGSSYWFKQAVAYGIGIGLAALICGVDYQKWSRYSLVGYWICMILLVLVLIPYIGTYRLGARRWINLGFVQFQPSELAKLAFIFMQAHYLSQPIEELQRRSVFVKSLALTALPFVLILKEPDLGSALVFFPVALVMMFAAGVPRRLLAKLVGGVTVLVALLLVNVLYAPPQWQVTLEEYQRQRLLVFFGMDFAPRDATPAQRQQMRALQRAKSYNVEQALISVGSGGLTGKGWRQGTQNSLGYLPRAVAHNDFIFSVIAEEKGFVGSVVVISLYTVVLFCGLRIAGQARDRLGKLLAVGVVTLLFSHVFVNIGMNIRLMPVTGIPLPLLSYGGTSVVCSLVALGVLQNIYLHRRSY